MSLDRFPNLEFLRVMHIVLPHGILPISKSKWWHGVKSGKYPKPVSSDLLGKGITAWSRRDIESLINNINDGGEFNE